MSTLAGSFAILKNPDIMSFMLKGACFTLLLAAVSITASLGVASVLALVRNYCTRPAERVFRWAATAYIELFRNTPLLFWIFIGTVFFPAPGVRRILGLSSVETKLLFKCTIALTIFESAIIAEIIRGGLNAISKGQFEAGYAQGFNIVQVMWYIILPQAFRKIIPTLMSQVITIIKDTSFYGQRGHHRTDGPGEQGAGRGRHVQRHRHHQRIRRVRAVRVCGPGVFRHQLQPVLRCPPCPGQPGKGGGFRNGG